LTRHLVFVEAKAQKQFRKIPEADRERILQILRALENKGLLARVDLKKLRGCQRHFRARIGDFRILFELTPDQTIVVYSISQREKAYK
jgi:mRNA-degrading endonuclease RelE of RelBE toxin-antitoxin system